MKKNKITLGKTVYIVAILALIVGGLLLVLEKSHVTNLYTKPIVIEDGTYKEEPRIDYSPASPTDNDDIDSKKESGSLNNADQGEVSSEDPISVTLTAATQDVAGGPVVVRVLLTDIKSGECKITISNGLVTKEYLQKVVNAGTYYNCEAVNIPALDLSEGVWTVKADIVSDNRMGSASQEVNVEL